MVSVKDKFIDQVIYNNLTIAETVKLIWKYEGLEQDGIIGLKIKDFLNFNKELVLEYPDEQYEYYYTELVTHGKNRILKYYFSTTYEPNLVITFKQLLSFYIKNIKYQTDKNSDDNDD